MHIRPLTLADHAALLDLINTAYRSGQGWTHEAALLTGPRLTSDDLQAQLQDPDLHFQGGFAPDLVGSYCLQQNHFGLLVVDPRRQQSGLGKRLIEHACHLLRERGHTQITLTVLAQRPELIAYYQRRGFQLTGGQLDFPSETAVGEARQPLHLLEMARWLI